jgi:SAM-dependent methyltransferase
MYEEKMAGFYEMDNFDLLSSSHDQVLKQLRANHIKPKKVFDVGCGTGMFLEKLTNNYDGLHLTGSDFSPDMLQLARSKPGLRELSAFVADLQNIFQHLAPQTFDLVCLHYVLCYISNTVAFPIIAQLLQPGGIFSLTTMTKDDSFPTLRQLSDFIDQEEADALSNTPQSKEALKEYIESSGLFEVLSWDTLQKEILFGSKEELSDFVFRSGWVSEVSEQYQPAIEQGLENLAFPIPEFFSAEVVLLRVK